MSLMLALDHFGALHLPGCGPGSGCAEAAASVWGTVPYIRWPVSFLGLAYFAGVLVAWLTSRSGFGSGLRILVRLGVLISIGFTIILFLEGHICKYCLAAHGGNLLFWILMESTSLKTPRFGQGFVKYAAVFVLCSALLAVADARGKAEATARAEQKLADTTAAFGAAATRPAAEPEVASLAAPESEVNSDLRTSANSETEAADSQPSSAAVETEKPFTGRYRLGPETAAIRVVLIGDYQCRECRRIETDVLRVYQQRDDMSVSFKHYPMCSDCNKTTNSRRHPNACWAARAAETAGLLHGNEGFWEMHNWLYERGGAFTNQELPPELQRMGYDVGEFVKLMSSEQPQALIEQDVEEAVELGIWFTPTVFINGIELRGWEAPNAIERAVAALATTNPEPRTAAADHPPRATEKLIGDWLEKPLQTIPETEAFRALGPHDAPVRIVVFGDYQQKGTAELDALIRPLVEQRGDIRYEYRHFPFNQECNPAVKVKTDYVNSCRAALAGEAAGRVAGADVYWKMHVWLLEHRDDFSEEALSTAAAEMGIDVVKLHTVMQDAETADAVRTDALLGSRIRALSVPTLFVNGRLVPRWMRESESILPNIVERAARGAE